jgi:clan AA aspartic protease (TIGR02281 family)
MIFYKTCKFYIIIAGLIFLSGCSVVKFTGAALGTAGKAVYTTAKVTGKVIGVTAKVAGKTAVATGKGVRTVVNMAAGKHTVKLTRRGNSLTTSVLLNRKVREDLVIDTGATDTVISSSLAKKIGISAAKGQNVLCQVADGRTVKGKQVNIKEVRVGGAKVYNVQAIVLDSGEIGNSPGLLGMSFLNNFVFKVDTEKELLVLQKR